MSTRRTPADPRSPKQRSTTSNESRPEHATKSKSREIKSREINNPNSDEHKTKSNKPYRPLHHRSDGDLARPWGASRTAVVAAC